MEDIEQDEIDRKERIKQQRIENLKKARAKAKKIIEESAAPTPIATEMVQEEPEASMETVPEPKKRRGHRKVGGGTLMQPDDIEVLLTAHEKRLARAQAIANNWKQLQNIAQTAKEALPPIQRPEPVDPPAPVKQEKKKPKKKVIVYQDSSDESSDEEERIIIRKPKKRTEPVKQQPVYRDPVIEMSQTAIKNKLRDMQYEMMYKNLFGN